MIDIRKMAAWYGFQARFYHLWRDRYDGPLVRAVVRLLAAPADAAIMDVGCGSGLFAIGIAPSMPQARVICGLDYTPELLAIAHRHARRRGCGMCHFIRGDAGRLPFPDGAFDRAVCAGLLPLLNDPTTVLRELRRAVKSGGRLVIVEFDRTAMTPTIKWFFRLMLFGYHVVARMNPGWRFAADWNIARSTVSIERLEEQLHASGWRLETVERIAGHYMAVARKDD